MAADDVKVEVARLQEQVKTLFNRVDNAESVVSKMATAVDEAHDKVTKLRHRVMLVAVSALTLIASQAPELFGLIAKLVGIF